MTGVLTCSMISENITPRRLFDMWRAVVTVLCTMITSAPASAARGANFFVFAGITETAAATPAPFNFLYAATYELIANRLCIQFLEEYGRMFRRGLRYLQEKRRRVFVSDLYSVEIEDSEAAVFSEVDGEGWIDNCVHGGGHEGDVEPDAIEIRRNIHHFGVDGYVTGGDGYIIESVGWSQFFQ